MAENPIDVNYVAHLARLKLSDEEVATFQKQLGDILGYVNLLQKADVSQVEDAYRAAPAMNNLRVDAVTPSFSVEVALSNAPLKANNLIQMPKIVE
jgi:aspartyl-tRNA(Asn)/glutamyl-tRNA(Gln) amidotransferase subunit C